MTEWSVNNYGAKVATIDGWQVIVHRGIVTVYEPCKGWSISVDERGLHVYGEEDNEYRIVPETVHIPWPVIKAMIEAQAMAAKSENK